MTERLRLSEDNRRWWTLGAMSFALFMIMLDNTAVNVALPSIQQDFGASLSALEWTVNAYTLTFAVLLVTGGRLGDIFGRRRMFLFGVVVFALASATIGFAPSDGWLVASRAIQGIGAAFMMPAHPLDHLQRVPAAGARQGDRHLGRRLRHRARDRPGRRRLADRGRSPGARSSSSTSPSPPARSPSRCSRRTSRATRPSTGAIDFPGIATMTDRADRARLRARRGQRVGLGLAGDPRAARASAVALVAFVVDRAPRPRRPVVDFDALRSQAVPRARTSWPS